MRSTLPIRGRAAAACLVTCKAFTGPLYGQQAPVNARDITLDTVRLAGLKRKALSFDSAHRRDTSTIKPNDSVALHKADSVSTVADSGFAKAVQSVVDTSKMPIATECVLNAIRKRQYNPHLYSYGCRDGWLSLRSREEADEFFGGLSAGGVVALSVGGDQSALYTELLSDNVWLFSPAGFARVGLSAQVSARQDSGKTTVTQFFQGGGNAVLYLALPIASYLNFGRLDNPMLLRRFDLFLVGAGGADVPKFGGPSVDPAGSVRVGLALQGHLNTEQRLFRFFVDANGHLVQGTSAAFYRNLTGRDAAARPFFAGTATLGVDLRQAVRLGIRFAGSGLVSQKPQFTVQFLNN